MPTPIGHSLITTAIYVGVKNNKTKFNWYDYLVFLLIGILPDFDFIPGLIVGEPSRYHHGFSHSLMCGMIIGAVVGFVYGKIKKQSRWKYSVIFFGVYSSHILADFFGVDTRFPYGEPVFSPFWNEYLLSPISIFLDVHRSAVTSDFFISLFNSHNFKAVLIEIVIGFPIIMFVYLKKKKLSRERGLSKIYD